MSQIDPLAGYKQAIQSFKKLKSLFGQKPVNLALVWTELGNCCNEIFALITMEEPDSVHLTSLNQIRTQLLKLIDIVHSGTGRLGPPVNQSTSGRELKTIQGFIEQPQVGGLSEIAGLQDVKKLLKSLVILPRSQPQLFDNRRTTNSILLYGPPGTGKTKLVQTLAWEGKALFYSVSAGNILSSYIGESEKTLQNLFSTIKNNDEFSILFIDEIDSISKKRRENDQDYSRRLKTEFMCQMSKIENCRHMFVFCATNCPWDLDTAVLRRFQNHIYIPLPNKLERLELLKLLTKHTQLECASEHFSVLLDKTEGYSGSDISNIVQYALDTPLMELEDTRLWKQCPDGYIEPIIDADDFDDLICCKLSELPNNSVRARQVHINDFINATDRIHLTVSREDIKKYELFNKQ